MADPIVFPGTVEWSGENPGISLKDQPDGPFVALASFFRVVLRRTGSLAWLFAASCSTVFCSRAWSRAGFGSGGGELAPFFGKELRGVTRARLLPPWRLGAEVEKRSTELWCRSAVLADLFGHGLRRD